MLACSYDSQYVKFQLTHSNASFGQNWFNKFALALAESSISSIPSWSLKLLTRTKEKQAKIHKQSP